MLISREILNERLGRTSEATIGLRDGQVVLGKVHKIFPNNRAEVQIGSHRFIAEIETPLAVGERYIFQVNHKGDQLIHLKVIGTQINEIKPENITALLRQINVRVNDVSITFVQSLMNERIPFIPRELVDALQLMDRVGHSPAVQTLIKELMI